MRVDPVSRNAQPDVRLSPRSRRALVVVQLLLMAALLVTSSLDESPTADEPLHLVRGLAFFWGPDRSLSIAHPPLGNAFAALPVVLSEPKPYPLGRYPGYERAEPKRLAKFLWRPKHYEHTRHWFFYARMMIAAATLGMAWHLYGVSRKLFGSSAALVALFFVATHPTLIAHGRLVTTDMPLTVLMVAGLGELLLFLVGRSRWHALAAILLTSLAPTVKYSGVLLIPIVVLFCLGAALGRFGRFRWTTRLRALGTVFGMFAVLGATSLLMVNAAYGFERTGWTAERILAEPEPPNGRNAARSQARLVDHSFVAQVPGWVPIPLPYTFLFGIASLREHVALGHGTTFFGKVMRHGHPAYFPVLLLVKTPSLQLAGLACAAWFALRRRRQVRPVTWALVLYVAIFVGVAMRTSINIGVRHVLPVVPVLALLAALGWTRTLHSRRASLGPAGRGAALLAIALHLLGLAWTFPDYISDFNALVLGRIGGERISIVGEEWDQDMYRLARLAEQHGIKTLYFDSSTPTTKFDLARHGIKMIYYRCSTRRHLPRDAYVGVSARTLARDSRGCWDWIKQKEPVLQVAEHIFVYHTGDPPPR